MGVIEDLKKIQKRVSVIHGKQIPQLESSTVKMFRIMQVGKNSEKVKIAEETDELILMAQIIVKNIKKAKDELEDTVGGIKVSPQDNHGFGRIASRNIVNIIRDAREALENIYTAVGRMTSAIQDTQRVAKELKGRHLSSRDREAYTIFERQKQQATLQYKQAAGSSLFLMDRVVEDMLKVEVLAKGKVLRGQQEELRAA